MSMNALLFGAVAGILSVISYGGLGELFITNVLLGFIAGKITDKNKV